VSREAPPIQAPADLTSGRVGGDRDGAGHKVVENPGSSILHLLAANAGWLPSETNKAGKGKGRQSWGRRAATTAGHDGRFARDRHRNKRASHSRNIASDQHLVGLWRASPRSMTRTRVNP